jgi:large subunit ribosomal protein L10
VGKFIKTFGLPKIKVGVIGEKVLSSEEILQLAALPSREILLATLLTRLKSPLNGLNYSLAWNLQKLVLVLKRIEEKQRPS